MVFVFVPVLDRHKQFNILLRRSVQEHLRRWNIIITQVRRCSHVLGGVRGHLF